VMYYVKDYMSEVSYCIVLINYGSTSDVLCQGLHVRGKLLHCIDKLWKYQ